MPNTNPARPWIPEDTFGCRLAQIRQHMHWNVLEAATACGVGAQSWRNWEHGRSPHHIHDVARQIADATGCDYRWLMMGLSAKSERPAFTVHDGGKRSTSERPLPFLHLVP